MAEFELKTVQDVFYLNGDRTELVATHFGDQIFVVVTQYEKLGTLIHARTDRPPNVEGPPVYSIQTLMGSDDVVLHTFARRLMDEIANSSGGATSLLFAIALKDNSLSNLQPVIAKIVQNKVW
ncbi:proteasome assembly chaperone 3-like [Oscarella lobularis]|uniref:proteasome assembly chaperone 3-like n=1 Tax=Oscarella lobularis TaxID=121494 RepID=UPI0033130CAB